MPANASTSGADSQTGRTLLVLDDDDLFRAQLSDKLAEAGFAVHSCASLAQLQPALASLNDLWGAVLDMRLDDGLGLDAINQVQSRFPDCRVVMLTGYGSIPTAVEATRRGALNYLLKPASLNDILAALESAMAVPDEEENVLPDAPPTLDRLEWDYIQFVLQRHDGNVSAAARDLGIDRRTLQRRLKKRPSQQDYDRDR